MTVMRLYGGRGQNMGYQVVTRVLGRYCLTVKFGSHFVAYVPGIVVGSYRIVGTICSGALSG